MSDYIESKGMVCCRWRGDYRGHKGHRRPAKGEKENSNRRDAEKRWVLSWGLWMKEKGAGGNSRRGERDWRGKGKREGSWRERGGVGGGSRREYKGKAGGSVGCVTEAKARQGLRHNRPWRPPSSKTLEHHRQHHRHNIQHNDDPSDERGIPSFNSSLL